MEQKHPLPPFTRETALQKVQMAEDAWNTRDPNRVSLAYSPDTEWRNRSVFLSGREQFPERVSCCRSINMDYLSSILKPRL